jgi:hypothetical protein
MQHKRVRIALLVLEAFVALTAIVSGVIALAGGLPLSLEWLQGTPFSDYTIPMLLLVIVVGGSSLIAAQTVFTRGETGVFASLAAGLILAGYVAVEVAMIGFGTLGVGIWLQGLYLLLGLLIFGLAAYLWVTEVRHHPVQRPLSHA